jgi:hypothetical protein
LRFLRGALGSFLALPKSMQEVYYPGLCTGNFDS